MSSTITLAAQPRLFDPSTDTVKMIERVYQDPRSAAAYERVCAELGVEPRRP